MLVAEDACNEGEGAVVRQRHIIAVMGTFLIGCAVLLLGVGCSGTSSETSGKEQASSPEATASEEARCEGTRTIKHGSRITNDIPGCPKGGLLLGTEGSDQTRSSDPARPSLDGGDGDDTIRGLGGSDYIFHGSGDDVVYGGDGNDEVVPDSGSDVIYGGDGNDFLLPIEVGGTSSIAVLAGTNTMLTRTTTWIAVARRMPAPGALN